MSAEHTPLTPIPDGTAAHIGTVSLNGEPMEVYAEPDELPLRPNKRAECQRHLVAGLQVEMMRDFWMAGCDFDRSREEGVVRVQFSCAGPSNVLKHCRLTLTQYDTEGNTLNSGKINQEDLL